jgi:hypothetical protein
MFVRAIFAVLALALILTIAGCAVHPTPWHNLESIAIIPSSQLLSNPGETSQFIAIGTFSSNPITVDMTDQVTWASSDVGVATIDPAGLATVGLVSDITTITAIGIGNHGAKIVGTATLLTGGGGSGQLPTLAVVPVGLGSGTVTSDPPYIKCASGSSAGCTGTFPLNTLVTLTAAPSQGSQPGGWSSNCTPVPPTDPTASSCTITMGTNSAGQPANEAVGVIFNPSH